MKRRSSFALFWIGQDSGGQLVTVYRKLVNHKDGSTYTLRALTHTPVDEFAEIKTSEDSEDLKDDSACWKQIRSWCNLYGWRKNAPIDEGESHALAQQTYMVD